MREILKEVARMVAVPAIIMGAALVVIFLTGCLKTQQIYLVNGDGRIKDSTMTIYIMDNDKFPITTTDAFKEE